MSADAAIQSERSADSLVARLFDASLGALDVMAVYVGDRLGLYRALSEIQPATAGELAAQAAINSRYAREWLEQQAATGILDVLDVTTRPDDRRYALPSAFVEPLLDLDSTLSITPLGRSVMACAKVLPALLDAYRSGGGVGWSDYGPDMIEAQGDFNRPWLIGSFGQNMLPAIPSIHRRLVADPPARVADVACGAGWASIAIARGYPAVRVDGFDLDESSIAMATANAARAGVADRVTFATRDAADPAAAGQYDLVVIIEAVHDMTRPVEVLAAIRQILRPGGLVLIADEKTGEVAVAPADELERFYYGFSLFTCLPAAMGEEPTAATGTVMRPSTFRRYAMDAGFRTVEPLDTPETDTLRFYLLTP